VVTIGAGVPVAGIGWLPWNDVDAAGQAGCSVL